MEWSNEMINAGIVGGAGYVAGELIRLLLGHPEVEISFVCSESHAGRPLYDAHPDLLGETSLHFVKEAPSDREIDVLFLCAGHGTSAAFLDGHPVGRDVKVIDLSADFRLAGSAGHGGREFVYGLPELQRARIRAASSIANPGCFATLIQLALLPLADEGLLKSSVHVNGITGSTGAGARPAPTTHFTWRSENVSIYRPFEHQHVDEVVQGLRRLQPGFDAPVRFIPMRGNFTRGIFATAYTECPLSGQDAAELYESFYAGHPFTHVAGALPDLKSVVNTNKAILHPSVHDGLLLVTGAIDNLLKGAAGQAVQNMNLIFGFNEKTGLGLKGSGM